MQSNKPFYKACEENKAVILECIQPILKQKKTVLEIASGTGQHAVHFAKAMPGIIWQCSDRQENTHGIDQWLCEENLSNTPQAIILDVSDDPWPLIQCDTVFSANAVHIMSLENVEIMFKKVTSLLPKNGDLLLYGPFNYNGSYTSGSNAQFDIWLYKQNPESGIRDFETLDGFATQGGMTLMDDIAMPVNNRILHWRKIDP